jgi:hypothetical protein
MSLRVCALVCASAVEAHPNASHMYVDLENYCWFIETAIYILLRAIRSVSVDLWLGFSSIGSSIARVLCTIFFTICL